MSPTAELHEELLQLRSADQTALTVRRVRPRGEVRARLGWVHGVAEHGGRYLPTLRALAERGFESAIVDLRGHGGSAGRRVHLLSFDEYLDDVEALLDHLGDSGDSPLFALGHSMGGLVLTRTLQERRHALPPLRGAVLLSPFFGLSMQLPIWKEVAGRALSRLLPWFAMPTDLDVAALSKDPAVGEAYLSDPHISKKATARWYTETVSQLPQALQGAEAFDLPLLMMHGEEDGLTCVESAKTFYGRVPSADKELRLWPGLRHELLNEVEREQVLEHLVAWLEAHLEG